MILTLLLALLLAAPAFPAAIQNAPRETAPVEHPPVPAELLPAMQRALDGIPTQIEIVEVSHFPVPEGVVDFERRDLINPVSPQAPARWRGHVTDSAGHRFSIWAEVRLTSSCRRVVATEVLRPDVPVRASQIREEDYSGFPSESCFWSAENAVGQVPIRTISAGGTLTREALTAPPAIVRGDAAVAEYRRGGVHLSVPVIAQRTARPGETIPVENATSHKVFQARVEADGTLVVEDSEPKKP